MLKCQCYPECPDIRNYMDLCLPKFLFCSRCLSFARDEGRGLGRDPATRQITQAARAAFEAEKELWSRNGGMPFPYRHLNEVVQFHETSDRAYEAFLDAELPRGLVPDWRPWVRGLPLFLWPVILELWQMTSEILVARAILEPGGLS